MKTKLLIEEIRSVEDVLDYALLRGVHINFPNTDDEHIKEVLLANDKVKWLKENIPSVTFDYVNGSMQKPEGPFKLFTYVQAECVKPYQLYAIFQEPKDAVYYKMMWGND